MPLSWGRRYCVYKYQGFLFYIVNPLAELK